jgi:hypothetical protein
MGVLSEEEPKAQSGKNKIKTLLTRPASLEMTHYPLLEAIWTPRNAFSTASFRSTAISS